MHTIIKLIIAFLLSIPISIVFFSVAFNIFSSSKAIKDSNAFSKDFCPERIFFKTEDQECYFSPYKIVSYRPPFSDELSVVKLGEKLSNNKCRCLLKFSHKLPNQYLYTKATTNQKKSIENWYCGPMSCIIES